MRLINTATGRFEEFFDNERPRYAILSHTWGREEASYLDLLILSSDVPANTRGLIQSLLRNPRKDSEGFRKIDACCRLARSRGLDWAWIDSCCIDKSSSAELSEAINSMWGWYRGAAECYVYLSDVSAAADQLRSSAQVSAALARARWFTRGWTLQELLAPERVLFCNSRWEILARKADIGRELSDITGIPLVFLNGTYDPADCRQCSAAMKMSWLASRQTTRDEDMAYCMLGLFDVHMPLIYGEGRKAFMRLQLEILKRSDDDSIFAWTAPVRGSGLLATWPTAFAGSGAVVQINFPDDRTPWLPATMTSIGLEMRGRYQRHDPHQLAIDAKHGVQTISTALIADDSDNAMMMMHCGPCRDRECPITENWGPRDRGVALLIILMRVGSTWQRVNCRELDFREYSMYRSSELDAYTIYYIPQEGL